MKKKLLLICVTAVTTLCLCACGKSEKEDTPATTAEAVTDEETTAEKAEATDEKETEATTEATTEKKTEATTEKKTEATTAKATTEATTAKATTEATTAKPTTEVPVETTIKYQNSNGDYVQDTMKTDNTYEVTVNIAKLTVLKGTGVREGDKIVYTLGDDPRITAEFYKDVDGTYTLEIKASGWEYLPSGTLITGLKPQ